MHSSQEIASLALLPERGGGEGIIPTFLLFFFFFFIAVVYGDGLI